MTIRLTIEAYADAIRKVLKDTLRSVMRVRATAHQSQPMTRLQMYVIASDDRYLGEAVFNEAVDAKWDELESAFVTAQVLKVIAGRMERQAMRDWEEGN